MQIQRVLVAKCTKTVRMYSKTLSDLRVASARGQFEGESAALMLRVLCATRVWGCSSARKVTRMP